MDLIFVTISATEKSLLMTLLLQQLNELDKNMPDIPLAHPIPHNSGIVSLVGKAFKCVQNKTLLMKYPPPDEAAS